MLKHKVFAYITRIHHQTQEILVFEHRDYPEAGIQVPAGTIEENELPIDALKREVKEETGLEIDDEIRFMGNRAFIHLAKNEIHNRFFYQVNFKGDCPRQFQHTVTGKGEDENLVFNFSWMNLNELPSLIADHDAMLSEILT